ncbi:unnamed protein product, partial [marine sediment metagenome]
MTEKTFVKKLENIFITEGFLTKKEIGAGYGVADLVLVKLSPKQCTVRIRNKQFKPLLNEQYFKIFQYLPEEIEGKPANLEYLVEQTNLSKSFLKYTLLARLEKDGYIKKTKDDFYFRINGWMPIAKEIIAIEAKLKNWKRGFEQANRYKSFANKVYLAVPLEISHLVDRSLLKAHNVGLIVFDPKHNIKKATHIKRVEPLSICKYNLVPEF